MSLALAGPYSPLACFQTRKFWSERRQARLRKYANTSQIMGRWRALLLYLALSVPFGIAVHLGSEFAGLGRDADDLAFSPLHAYLAVIAIGALAAFLGCGGFFAGVAERRRRIGLMARALPFGGSGVRFFALSAGLQFAFFVVTQLGEGCPLCKGDALVGVAAALAASAVGSCALMALRKQIVRAFAVLGSAVERVPRDLSVGLMPRFAVHSVITTYSTFAVTFGNRPPPLRS